MSDLICRKTMMRCQTPGMCAPYGGCRTEAAIPADQVLVPRDLVIRAIALAEDAMGVDFSEHDAIRDELRSLLHP
ncbi:hypothetical protein HBO32_12030 [Pseudomonas nitroreducens]|uniref:hypothetical protein n=1 Tax=Pseudomonas nitroreducens TaxID=46680 RepID=UPI001475FBB8|nr:hypothetical protein [Pseudomonas nitroreducens]NMZ73833.1 hypothetical protein [Pseudomonas nitroreducens]